MEWNWWKDWWRLKKWRQMNSIYNLQHNGENFDDYYHDNDDDDEDDDENINELNCCYCDECIVSFN